MARTLGWLSCSFFFFPSLAFAFGCFHMSIINFAQPVILIWWKYLLLLNTIETRSRRSTLPLLHFKPISAKSLRVQLMLACNACLQCLLAMLACWQLKVAPYSFTIASMQGESSSNLRALKGECQYFSIFYDLHMSTKSKPDSEFSRISYGEIP